MRLDQLLVLRTLCESRTKAQTAVKAGLVTVNGTVIDKCAYDCAETDTVALLGDPIPFVGRGGLKLEAALEAFGLDCQGIRAADIGASTGGFTDCLLRHGAARVYAVDCGSGQLHESLRRDPRVVSLENTNAKALTVALLDNMPVDLVVMDVSFISQTKLYPAVQTVLTREGRFVSLIKPQFEVGPRDLGKNGILKDDRLRRHAVDNVLHTAEIAGFRNLGLIPSPIRGGDGNTEFLALFSRT